MKYLFLILLLTGCEDRTINRETWPPAEANPLKACRLALREELPIKKYCGKACWHTVVRSTYTCDDGVIRIVEE